MRPVNQGCRRGADTTITYLELYRYLWFGDATNGAAAIGVCRRRLRVWERRQATPGPKTRAKFESVFGLPWSVLAKQAPIRITEGEPT